MEAVTLPPLSQQVKDPAKCLQSFLFEPTALTVQLLQQQLDTEEKKRRPTVSLEASAAPVVSIQLVTAVPSGLCCLQSPLKPLSPSAPSMTSSRLTLQHGAG